MLLLNFSEIEKNHIPGYAEIKKGGNMTFSNLSELGLNDSEQRPM